MPGVVGHGCPAVQQGVVPFCHWEPGLFPAYAPDVVFDPRVRIADLDPTGRRSALDAEGRLGMLEPVGRGGAIDVPPRLDGQEGGL